MQSLIGTGVAVVTPFSMDGAVDYPSLKKIIKHLIEGKVEYLVALGTTGEVPSLTDKEEREILDTFFQECEGKIPVVIGVGGNATEFIVNRTKEYVKAYPQAEAILSVSPYYNKPTQEGIIAHYSRIAESTDKPIILYNVPHRTGSNMTAATTLELASIPNIVAMKEASGNMAQIMRLLKDKEDDFLILSGDDPLSLPMLALGGKGTISVSANAFPLIFSNMVRAGLAGEMEEARRLHHQLLDVTGLLFKEGNPAGVKAAMHLRGLLEPHVRLPLIAASDKLREEIALHMPIGILE
ncbi:MAG: 4-hydroxy-tetrahydrodipicolinate synthase [Bacteroidota bacterium]